MAAAIGTQTHSLSHFLANLSHCCWPQWAGGHDNWWWHSQLPAALAWLLAAA
jgi:enterochelin esterase-like enzyme